MSRKERMELGRGGERAAAAYLLERGYRLLQSNVRSRQGEADLILRDGETLVFCEVKTKTDPHSGHAGESYGAKQQQRLRRLILAYLQKTGWDGPLRIDLLALQKSPDGPHFEVHHYKNAVALRDNW